MAGPVKEDDNPTTRLAKLLPAEVTGLYVTVGGMVSAASSELEPSDIARYLFFSALAIALAGLWYIWQARQVRNLLHLTIYVISFLLWAATIESELIGRVQFDGSITFPLSISIVTAIWTFVLPWALPSEVLVASRDP